MIKIALAIYLFLMGFFIGSFKKEIQTQPEIKTPPIKIVRNIDRFEPAQNNSILVLCTINGNESQEKVVASREIQLRIYAEDGTFTLVNDTDWVNNTDVGQQFTSKWMMEK